MPSVYENAVAEGLTSFTISARDVRKASSFRAAGEHAVVILETARKVRLRLEEMLAEVSGTHSAEKGPQSGEGPKGANAKPSVLVGVTHPLSDLETELGEINALIDDINELIG